MSNTYTYAEIVAELQTLPDVDESDYVDAIPRFVKRAEERLAKDLRLETFRSKVTLTTGASGLVTKPSDLVQVTTISYVLGGKRIFVNRRSFDYVTELLGVVAPPEYFCEFNETTWQTSPVPSSSMSLEVRYLRRPDSLVDVITGTYLSTKFGDCFLYACMIEATTWLNHQERLKEWGDLYGNALKTVVVEMERSGSVHDQAKPETRD